MSRLHALLMASSVALGCGDAAPPAGPEDPDPVFIPASMTLVSGDAQTGRVRTTLPMTLVVKVTDANGVPVPDAPVVWTSVLGTGGRSKRSIA